MQLQIAPLMRGMHRAAAAGILFEVDVSHPMVAVFDRSMTAVPCKQVFRSAPVLWNRSDAVGDFGAFFAGFTRFQLAFDPEYLREMRIIDRSAQRRHGRDASAVSSSMSFGDFFLERPCRFAVPIDHAERLEGFRCILLHRHQVVSVVAIDDAAAVSLTCAARLP